VLLNHLTLPCAIAMWVFPPDQTQASVPRAQNLFRRRAGTTPPESVVPCLRAAPPAMAPPKRTEDGERGNALLQTDCEPVIHWFSDPQHLRLEPHCRRSCVKRCAVGKGPTLARRARLKREKPRSDIRR